VLQWKQFRDVLDRVRQRRDSAASSASGTAWYSIIPRYCTVLDSWRLFGIMWPNVDGFVRQIRSTSKRDNTRRAVQYL